MKRSKSLIFLIHFIKLTEVISWILGWVIELVPNFKLAHLIRGDILAAYSMNIDNFGGNAIEINSKKVTELKKEAKRRIKGFLITHKDNGLPKFNVIPNKNDKYLIYVFEMINVSIWYVFIYNYTFHWLTS